MNELVSAATLPGSCWLVDLPGDGSNLDAPGAPPDPYRLWPHVLLEAVNAVADPVVVGHSEGGQHLLSVPSLEDRVAGIVLISSAPDAGWMPRFEATANADPLPGYAEAAQRYACEPSVERLRDLAMAAAGWHFEPVGLAAGRALLARLPYNPVAAEWFGTHVEPDYVAAWWPAELPTLIISGAGDRVVDQRLWNDPYYEGSNVRRVIIDSAGHWPWIEQPAAVRNALGDFAIRLARNSPEAGCLSPAQRSPTPNDADLHQ